MPGPQTYDKNAYADFLSYFEQVAANLVPIGHSASNPAYIRMSLLEAMEQESTSAAPIILVAEPPHYRLINNTGENVLKEWQGSIMILKEVAEGDVEAEKAAQSYCSLLMEQVLAKMRKDRRMRHLLDVTFDGTQGYPVRGAMMRTRAGWMQTIQFKSTAFTAMDTDLWQNEDMGEAPTPFATVIDGAQTYTLQMYGSYTCSVPVAGTVTIENSDLSYSEQVTAPSSTDTTHELPDVDHTDTDGSTVTLPGMTPMVCSAPADGVVDVNGSGANVPSGSTVTLHVVNEDLVKIGTGLTGTDPLYHTIGAQPLHVNGAQAVNIQPTPGQTPFNLKVKLNGSAAGTFDGTDTVNVEAATVLPATITLSGTGLAAFAQQTLGCTESGYTSYTWHLVNTAYPERTITLSGQNVSCYPTFDGTWTVNLMVTGTGGRVGYATTTFTVSNGLRPTVLVNNTAPPGAATVAIVQNGAWCRYNTTGANNVNHYQAARLTGGTGGGIIFRDTPITAFIRVGLSPGITYASASNQESDPAWDWIMGAWLSANNLVYVQDNGSVVSTTKYIHEGFWWRMDRAANGTIRLYRGTDIHNINTITHTYSLTNTSDLYIRIYNQAVRSHFELYYYGAAA